MSKSWTIAIIGTLIHLFLGSVYAWSAFQTPIMNQTGWNNMQTTMAFSLTILTLGLTASWAGGKIKQYTPQRMVMVGGVLFALGYIAASFAFEMKNLWLCYLSFGILGGMGLGLAYVTPVSVVSSWFLKRQGLATGIVVMGFGLGAFVMSKILAPFFLEMTNDDIALTFRYSGVMFLFTIPVLGYFLKFPAEENITNQQKIEEIKVVSRQKTIFIWLIFTLNIIVGMIFLSFQSPLLQELLRKEGNLDQNSLISAGATLVAVSAFFNAIGRFSWASLSDAIGRIRAFRLLLLVEVLCFFLLIFVENPLVFSALVCIILLCYGGSFGILPSLVKDEFGTQTMASMYGKMLTGWGVGGLLGTLFTAFLKDSLGDKASFFVFLTGLVVSLVAFLISWAIKKVAD